MENRVGTAGGTVEFEYKIESTEAGKWYQGKPSGEPSFFYFREDLFSFPNFYNSVRTSNTGYNR